MPLTKEEFKEAINELVEDANDPNGDFASLEEEFTEAYNDTLPHDPHLAQLFLNIQTDIRAVIAYVKSRNS